MTSCFEKFYFSIHYTQCIFVSQSTNNQIYDNKVSRSTEHAIHNNTIINSGKDVFLDGAATGSKTCILIK
jgi:hypothetical protein